MDRTLADAIKRATHAAHVADEVRAFDAGLGDDGRQLADRMGRVMVDRLATLGVDVTDTDTAATVLTVLDVVRDTHAQLQQALGERCDAGTVVYAGARHVAVLYQL